MLRNQFLLLLHTPINPFFLVVGCEGVVDGTNFAIPHVLQVAPNGPRGEIDNNNFLQGSENVFAGAAS